MPAMTTTCEETAPMSAVAFAWIDGYLEAIRVLHGVQDDAQLRSSLEVMNTNAELRKERMLKQHIERVLQWRRKQRRTTR